MDKDVERGKKLEKWREMVTDRGERESQRVSE